MKLQTRDSASPAELCRTLRQVNLFRARPDELLMDAATASEIMVTQPNEEIVRQGQALEGLYVIALERQPQLWWGLVHQWAVFHRNQLAALRQVAFESLRVPPLRALLDRASQFGTAALPEAPAELRLRQDELAQLLGMTRQSVNCEAKRLEREGHIRVVYGGIPL